MPHASVPLSRPSPGGPNTLEVGSSAVWTSLPVPLIAMAAMAVTIPACSCAALRSDVSKNFRLSATSSSRVVCSVPQTAHTVSKQDTLENADGLSRRNLLLASASGFASLAACNVIFQEEALAAATVAVGTFLPPAGVDDFVVFTPSLTATPALRAGKSRTWLVESSIFSRLAIDCTENPPALVGSITRQQR